MNEIAPYWWAFLLLTGVFGAIAAFAQLRNMKKLMNGEIMAPDGSLAMPDLTAVVLAGLFAGGNGIMFILSAIANIILMTKGP